MKKIITKRRIICLAVIVAIVIIPLLYSYFYLGAFWDPYSRLETLPVAVVNNDLGAVVNDTERNFGNEMCDNLKEDASLKFIFTDEEDARTGTEGKDYYAMIIIPDNFSQNIASASETEKQTATITFSPNEKRNYLASQILGKAVLQIEGNLRASVDKAIVQELADNLNAVPDQMIELQDGLGQLQDGSIKLQEGANTLSEGTTTFREKFTEFSEGVNTAQEGSKALTEGSVSLDNGIGELQAGANQLVTATKDLGKLSDGAQGLATGAVTFNTGLLQYTAGVDKLIASVGDTSAFLKQYVTTINPSIMKDPVFAGFITKLSDPSNAQSIATLQAASTQLKEASTQISAGAAQLSTGSNNLPELNKALMALSAGLAKAKAGSEKLSGGASSLEDGFVKINDATDKLATGANDIADGAAKLSSGTVELSEGIETAKTGVDTAITDTNDQLATLDGLAEFAEKPVSIEQDNITSIPNYGTAFAPYFLSLSLWVGALILFVGIYMDTEGKFQILSKNSEHKIARTFIYQLIGIAQAVALAFSIQYGLGLTVENELLYYGSCILVSMVFIAIIQFFMVHLKDLGKLISVVALILQLTSCGGTFPMETVSKLFNVLYPYMPMTYSVALFKQAISDTDTNEILYNGGILAAILVVFTAATILLSVVKFKKAETPEFVAVEQM